MRAWVLDEGADGYRLDDLPAPTIGPWDVQVALRTSALNHLDLWVAKGMPKPPSYPHVPGADGAGVVVDVGRRSRTCPRAPRSSIDPSTSCGRCEACLAGDIPYCPSFAVIGEHRWGTHADLVGRSRVERGPQAGGPLLGAGAARSASSCPPPFGWRAAAASRPGARCWSSGSGAGAPPPRSSWRKRLGHRRTRRRGDETTRAWAIEQRRLGRLRLRRPPTTRGCATPRVAGAVDVVIDNVGTATFERSLDALDKGGAAGHATARRAAERWTSRCRRCSGGNSR